MSSDPRPDNHETDDRAVATLIRAAGPRPPVPHERLDRVRAAAHETWQRETRRRSRRRRLWVAGALAAAASLVLIVMPRTLFVPGPGTPQGFTVESLSGTAWAGPVRQDAEPVAVGARFAPDAEVRTAAAGRVALRLESGHSVRLDHSTRVRVLPGGSLRLEEGAIYVDSHSFQRRGSDEAWTDSAALVVRTPFGPIEEIGTQFEVRLAVDTVHVRLREGAVILRHDGASYPVAVGTEFSLSADGTTATRTVPTHDETWDWAMTVVPAFDLEGSTAREFLDWVARERGLRLIFADENLARSADEIVLAGTLRGVPFSEALDVVLPTCRMSHRIAEGILTIEALPR